MNVISLQPVNHRLLGFLENLVGCTTEEEVYLVVANDVAALLGTDQVVALRRNALGNPRVAGVAGVNKFEKDTDFTIWVEAVARLVARSDVPDIYAVPADLADDRLNAERAIQFQEHLLHVKLNGPDGSQVGGLLAAGPAPFGRDSIEQLRAYARFAGHAAWSWRRKHALPLDRFEGALRKRKTRIVAAAIAVATLLLPVRLSALASGEVTPLEPMPITATQDGVVERILVRPNQAVSAGDVLLRFDAAVVRNRLEVARKAVSVADAELKRASGKAFLDEASRAELQTLRARVQERSAETRYLEELTERLEVRAPISGVAVFADAEEWMGRPVQTGERIMVIAEPSKVWLTLHLPPEEDIPLREQSPVRFNLDISPLDTIDARVVESGYEPVLVAEGKPAYLLRARFGADVRPPRIGLKGTATIYGNRVPLGYYLFRKPIRALRRMMGV